jgi:hypothetical protein
MSWQPIFRKGFNPVGAFTLAPLPNFKACVLVELMSIGGNPVARIRAYVGIDAPPPQGPPAGTLSVTYTPLAGNTFWVVDIPDANNIDLGEIATAIVNGGGVNLPPPPIVWG